MVVKILKRIAYVVSIAGAIFLLGFIKTIIFPEHNSEFTTAKIDLKTIVCGDCVESIKKALKSDGGVINTNVFLKTKTASVVFDEAKTNINKIESLIVKAGYDANTLIADSVAYRNLHECCKIWGDGASYMELRKNNIQGCSGGCCVN